MWARISLFLAAALIASLIGGFWLGHLLSASVPLNPSTHVDTVDTRSRQIGGIAAADVPEPPQPLVDGSFGVPRRVQRTGDPVPVVSAFDSNQPPPISITLEGDPILALIESRLAQDAPAPNAVAGHAPVPPMPGIPAPGYVFADTGAVRVPDAGTVPPPPARPAAQRSRIRPEDLPPELAFAVAQPAEPSQNLPPLAVTPAQPNLPPLATTPAQPSGSARTQPAPGMPRNGAGWQAALRSALAQCDALREPGRSECIYRARMNYCGANNAWGTITECPAAARPR